MKRYINGIRRPFLPKGKCRFVFFLIGTLLVLLFVRNFLLMQVEVRTNRGDLGLMEGDRVVVCRLSYGLRLPGMETFGYHRWGECNPSVGDLVVYDFPDGSGRISLDRVIGVPGDTLWLEDDPKSFTIVPDDALGVGGIILPKQRVVGRPVGISYSVDASQPFYRSLRSDRIFIEIE